MSDARPSLTDTLALPAHLAAAVWQGRHAPAPLARVWPSGHPALDAELPGGGWPRGSLTEILQTQGGLGEWRLLGPALQTLVAAGGQVLLIAPPWVPCGPALSAMGLPPEQLVWVTADTAAQRLWATEQALKAPCLSAVLAWLPQASAAQMRRLHAHASRHPGLLFALRPAEAAGQPSAAPLRLALGLADMPHPLQVSLLKRRGPVREAPLLLPHWPQGLLPLLTAASADSDRLSSTASSRAPDVALDGPGAAAPAGHLAQHLTRPAPAWH